MTTQEQDSQPVVLLAGATGDLGGRVARELIDRGATVRALVRPTTSADKLTALRTAGLDVRPADYDDRSALEQAVDGAHVVVSTLAGTEPVVLDAQTRLLEAAQATGVQRFVPSDFGMDFRTLPPGSNRNMDLRRQFARTVDASGLRATSVLNGAFADMMASAPAPVTPKGRLVLYFSSADQVLDFTTMDDTAGYTADVALDPQAPRYLQIAGEQLSSRQLAETLGELTGQRYRTVYAGGLSMIRGLSRLIKTVAPGNGEDPYPPWQQLQYLDGMYSGDGGLGPVDNDRYGVRPWTRLSDLLAKRSEG